MIRIIEQPMKRSELEDIAKNQFGIFIKAAVDIEKEIMAIGGELHADEEALLIEQEESKQEHIWGINLYPDKSGEEWIEFNSMINLKPSLGNRTRSIDNPDIRKKIIKIVAELIQK